MEEGRLGGLEYCGLVIGLHCPLLCSCAFCADLPLRLPPPPRPSDPKLPPLPDRPTLNPKLPPCSCVSGSAVAAINTFGHGPLLALLWRTMPPLPPPLLRRWTTPPPPTFLR